MDEAPPIASSPVAFPLTEVPLTEVPLTEVPLVFVAVSEGIATMEEWTPVCVAIPGPVANEVGVVAATTLVTTSVALLEESQKTALEF